MLKTSMQVFATLLAVGALGVITWRWRINGWGSLVWLSLIILIPLIRAPYARQTKDNTITEQPEHRTEQVLLALVAIGNGLVPIVHLATGIFSFADYALPNIATAFGTALLLPGFWLFWRSHADLGRNWSVTLELREDHSLVTSGVYSRIRHPMYTSLWLLAFAVPLLIHNWIAGFSFLVTFGLLYFVRIPHEEQMMRREFGHAYDEYCVRAGRLWPKVFTA